MTTNWKMQTFKFQLGGDFVTLSGDPSLGRTGVSLMAKIQTLRKEKSGFLIEFNHLGNESEEGRE